MPDIDVLRAATDKWGIKWKHLDPYEVLQRSKVRTPEQYVFSFLRAVKQDDVEIVEVGPERGGVLQVSIKIRFPVART